ncbi:MAG: redoxin family protein [Planctomycetia bacterium]|nr:redoxin family protein [Planctomycetia bacterium]
MKKLLIAVVLTTASAMTANFTSAAMAAAPQPAPKKPSPDASGASKDSKGDKDDQATYGRTFDDGEHTLTLTNQKGQEGHLLVKDKAGKVIYDGPMENDTHFAKLPAAIAAKLQRLVQKLTAAEDAEDEEKPNASATLHVGDAAPALAPSKWVKGAAVEKFEPGKIYILEFWATWCGPCAEAIPHLTKLQKRNADVTFIGMNCMEDDQSVVPAFVEKMGAKMGYRVAMDDAAGNMAKTWLSAAGQNGIPCTFVVGKDGKIAWIGHPMKLDVVLKEVKAGTFDAQKFAATEQKEGAGEEEIQAQAEELLEAGNIVGIDKLIHDHPKMAELQQAKFKLLMQKKQFAAAIALAEKLCDSQRDNGDLLYQIALELAIPNNPDLKPGLDVALKAALRANEVAAGNPAVLAALARVYFIRGDVEKAIAFQTKAVEKEDEENENRKTLAEYQAKLPGAKGTAAPAKPAAANAPKTTQQEKAEPAKEEAPPAEEKVTLHIGDAAPALKPSKWLKGQAVDKLEPGKIYVVEFWATWCGPCRASIPHLTELQKQNADVTFIGVNCLERDQTSAPAFVEKMGDKMEYRVAADDEEGSIAKAWLMAAGQGGIPAAFVVGKDGKIAWIGHPMKLDAVVKEVVAGTYDSKKAAAEADAETKVQEQLAKAMEEGDLAALDKIAKEYPQIMPAEMLAKIKFEVLKQKKDYAAVIALGKELCDSQKDNAELLNEIAWTMVDPENPIDKPDLDLALKAVQRANEITKGERFEILDTLARVLFTRGDVKKAIEMQTALVVKADEEHAEDAKKSLAEYKAKQTGAAEPKSPAEPKAPATAATPDAPAAAKEGQAESGPVLAAAINRALEKKEYRDNPNILNLMAWSLVDPENTPAKPDLDLALKVATRANELSKGESAEIMDTLARIYFNRGDVDKAIEWQTKAVDKSSANDKEQLTKSLAEYKAKKSGQAIPHK